jgi:hypothetical protein
MKIKEIKKIEYNIYEVTFTPIWIEKLFGLEEVTKKYKSTGREWMFGGGNVYINQKGEELRNGNWVGESIDIFIRKW